MVVLIIDKRERGVRGFLESLLELVGSRGIYLFRGKRESFNLDFLRFKVEVRDKRERMMGKVVFL